MSKALERVQNALKADERRHFHKMAAKVDSQNLGLMLDDLGDFNPRAKRGEFRKQVHRMILLNRSMRVGVKRSNLKEWHELSKFRPATEEDHKNFIGHVLNNFQLMARFTRFMRQSQDFFIKSEEERLTNGKPWGTSEFLNLMATKLHDAKISTAHLCWHEVVKPLRSHRANLQAGVDSLKAQLRQLRSDYLKEISTLRDSKHTREDPLDTIPDIRYFYEPLNSLEKSEQSFMIDLIREVLKMMMDSPDAQRIRSAALERFVSEVHDNELKELREEIQQKNIQLKELRQAQHFLETQLLNGFRSGKESNANTLEKMLHITEEQLAKVRNSFYALQKENQELQERYKSLDEERNELVQRLEQEIAQNSILEREIRRLLSVEEEQKHTIQTLENEHLQLKETIKEQQARLEKRAVVRRHFQARMEEADAPPVPLPEESCGFEQGSYNRPHLASEDTEQGEQGYRPNEMEAISEPEKEPEDASQGGLTQVELLQRRVAELEKLLREHVVQLSTLPAQELQEEATDLIRQAESLGCQVHFDPSKVRLCRCGCVLPEDAGSFCTKCGAQWTPGASCSHSSQQLAAEISSLREQIAEGEEALRDSLAEAGTGGPEGSFTVSRVLALPETEEEVSQEELEQREELMQLRSQLEDLKKRKLLAETSLLAQRTKEVSRESGPAVMTALDEEAVTGVACCDGVNCPYRRQVDVLKEMVAVLRGLSNEMGEKLQKATGEHLQMSRALTSVQGSLEAAAQVVEQTAREVDSSEQAVDVVAMKRMLKKVTTSLKETKRRSVFWRLYHNHGGRSRVRPVEGQHRTRHKTQEKRAALVHRTYEHLYKLDPLGRTAATAAPYHAATPHQSHRPTVMAVPPPAPPLSIVPKHTSLPAIHHRHEKPSSKDKNPVPISPVNLFAMVEETEKVQPMAPVFTPRKQPVSVRRFSKRSSGPGPVPTVRP